jgi:alpha-beta hydrolase superfamily lysophospholipase
MLPVSMLLLVACVLLYVQTAGCGKPVLLVHGFGASCGHYRKTIPFLAKNGFKVCT